MKQTFLSHLCHSIKKSPLNVYVCEIFSSPFSHPTHFSVRSMHKQHIANKSRRGREKSINSTYCGIHIVVLHHNEYSARVFIPLPSYSDDNVTRWMWWRGVPFYCSSTAQYSMLLSPPLSFPFSHQVH